jgi:orotate phosphoribosyltransferase
VLKTSTESRASKPDPADQKFPAPGNFAHTTQVNMFDISTTAAKILLKAGVVRFASTEASYFRLANNSLSPIYVDMRSLLGQPRPFDSIASLVAVHIQGMFPSLNERDAVVGIATGGIPYATLVANKLNMATGYIRKAAKEHGTGATLEGLGDPAPGSCSATPSSIGIRERA